MHTVLVASDRNLIFKKKKSEFIYIRSPTAELCLGLGA